MYGDHAAGVFGSVRRPSEGGKKTGLIPEVGGHFVIVVAHRPAIVRVKIVRQVDGSIPVIAQCPCPPGVRIDFNRRSRPGIQIDVRSPRTRTPVIALIVNFSLQRRFSAGLRLAAVDIVTGAGKRSANFTRRADRWGRDQEPHQERSASTTHLNARPTRIWPVYGGAFPTRKAHAESSSSSIQWQFDVLEQRIELFAAACLRGTVD